MAFIGSIQLRGFDKVEKLFKELPLKVQKRVIRPACRAAAKEVLPEVKNLAPERSGATKKSLKIRAAKRRNKFTAAVLIQTRKGDFKGDEFYAAFVEYGTKERIVKKTGKSAGSVRPHEFMKRGFENKKAEAEDVFERELIAGVMREAKA